MRLAALAISLALTTCAVGVEATTVAYATPAEGRAAGTVIGSLVELSGAQQACDVDLLVGGIAAQPIALQLVDATPAAQRQAIAHALGCWWARDPRDGSIVYTRSPRLPQGALSVRWVTSGLKDRRELEAPVRELLAPWLGGDAGLSYQPGDGVWPATFDAAGHARLVELLSLLERPEPRCSDLLPDPDRPDLERALGGPVRAATWGALARELSAQGHISVALGPGIQPSAETRLAFAAVSLREAVATINGAGFAAAVRHGVLCIDAAPIEEREHPASRRLLAILPIGHLLRSPLDGELVAVALQRAVAPRWWSQPGAGMRFLPTADALLVAADAEIAHQVLDALDRLDQHGLDEGIASLSKAP
jgi:hypothetical protein